MSNAERSYRNRVNGAIGVYPVELGDVYPNLEEVPDDAKPLAYVPITPERVEQVLGDKGEPDSEPDPTNEAAESADPTPARKGR